MKAYLKRFAAKLAIAAVMTVCFLFVEVMLKKTIRMMTFLELPPANPWVYYAILVVSACAVIAFRKL